MAGGPTFQFQGEGCVIDGTQLGWSSCTAYAMAMLIDAATDGDRQPNGCRVRKLTEPLDTDGGLKLGQVASVAEDHYGVRVGVRTGRRAIPVDVALRRIRDGRGFVLQGCNDALNLKKPNDANHAVYVHRVIGDDPDAPGQPLHAIVYDPQIAGGPSKWTWRTVVRFGARLKLDDAGARRLGKGRFYAGIAPRRPAAKELTAHPAQKVASGVSLRFGAEELKPGPRRFKAVPPPGKKINVRSRPDRIKAEDVLDTMARGERFVAFQRRRDGALHGIWMGNMDGTEWVHRAGLQRIDGGA